MKKIFVHAALAAFVAVLLASCGSTKIAIQEHSPIAVFSIVGNSQISWIDDDPNSSEETDSDGILSNMVSKLIDSQSPEILTAVDRLDYADDSIRQILPDMTGCEILPKDAVVSSQVYQDLTPSYYNLMASVKTATNYKDFTTISKKTARHALNGIGAKSAVILNFTFHKKLLKGNKWNGVLCGIVTMKAKLVDNRGKEIISKTYEVQTSEKTTITSHKYDKNAFVETFNDAIDSAIRQFALEFVGADDDTNAEALLEEGVQAQAIAIPIKAKSTGDSASQTTAEPAKTE